MSHTSKMHNSSSPPLLKCQEDAAPHQTAANSFTNKYTRKQHHLRTKTNPNRTTATAVSGGGMQTKPCREGGFLPRDIQRRDLVVLCVGHSGLCASNQDSRIWESLTGADKTLPANACQGTVWEMTLILSPCCSYFRESLCQFYI